MPCVVLRRADVTLALREHIDELGSRPFPRAFATEARAPKSASFASRRDMDSSYQLSA
jgi:hypothetical protein